MILSFKDKGYWILLIPFIILLQGCHKKQKSKETLKRLFIEEIKKVEIDTIEDEIYYEEIVDSIHHIPLKSINGGTNFIGSVDKIVLHENKLYILDSRISKGLICFDTRGNHIFSINKKGNGPGEFIKMSDFDIYDNQIHVYDEGNGRMSIFNLNGQYLKNGPKISNLGILPDCFVLSEGNYLWYNKNNCNEFGCFTMHITNLQGNLISNGINNEYLKGFNVDFGTPLARNGNDIAFTQILNDSIYLIEKGQKIKTPFVIDFGKYSLSEKEKKDLVNYPMQINSFITQSPKTPGLAYININDSFILSTFLQSRTFATLLIERKTGLSKIFKNYKFNSNNQIPTFTVVGNIKDRFIYYRNNENILNFIKNRKSTKHHPHSETLDTIHEDTNGIVSIVKFKSFEN